MVRSMPNTSSANSLDISGITDTMTTTTMSIILRCVREVDERVRRRMALL